MELDENALPLKEDAFIKVRPRLFIDGNYFVDLHPGSPSAAEVADGHTFGLDQTAHSVQLDEVLTTLQSDVRTDLQTFLDQFGNALIRYRGAEGLRELFRTSPPAYKFTAQVSESQLGTHRGDLRGVISGLGRVFRGLSRNQEALSDLITNLRRVTGAFAVEDAALGQAIERLPDFLAEGEPTFQALNSALPHRARLRPRGPARRAQEPRGAAGRAADARAAAGADVEVRAARPRRPAAADDPAAHPPRARERRPVHRAARVLVVLQRGRSSRGRTRPSSRRPIIRSTSAGASSRRPAYSHHRQRRRRAAAATPPASTCACSAAAARTWSGSARSPGATRSSA